MTTTTEGTPPKTISRDQAPNGKPDLFSALDSKTDSKEGTPNKVDVHKVASLKTEGIKPLTALGIIVPILLLTLAASLWAVSPVVALVVGIIALSLLGLVVGVIMYSRRKSKQQQQKHNKNHASPRPRSNSKPTNHNSNGRQPRTTHDRSDNSKGSWNPFKRNASTTNHPSKEGRNKPSTTASKTTGKPASKPHDNSSKQRSKDNKHDNNSWNPFKRTPGDRKQDYSNSSHKRGQTDYHRRNQQERSGWSPFKHSKHKPHRDKSKSKPANSATNTNSNANANNTWERWKQRRADKRASTNNVGTSTSGGTYANGIQDNGNQRPTIKVQSERLDVPSRSARPHSYTPRLAVLTSQPQSAGTNATNGEQTMSKRVQDAVTGQRLSNAHTQAADSTNRSAVWHIATGQQLRATAANYLATNDPHLHAAAAAMLATAAASYEVARDRSRLTAQHMAAASSTQSSPQAIEG